MNPELGTIDYIKPLESFPAKVQKRMLADGDNPDNARGAVLLRIDPEKEEGKLICQVGTGEASLAVKAVERVVGDVVGVDVNMGCPKKFSVGGGMGRLVSSDCIVDGHFRCIKFRCTLIHPLTINALLCTLSDLNHYIIFLARYCLTPKEHVISSLLCGATSPNRSRPKYVSSTPPIPAQHLTLYAL